MIVHSRPYQPDGIARQTSGAKIRAVVWRVGRAYIHICRLPLAGARENSGLESCLETGMLDGDVVDAGIQIGHPVHARLIPLSSLRYTRIDILGGDLHVRHRRACAVGD